MREGMARGSGAVACGVLFACAFPPVDRGALAFVALVPLLVAVRGASLRVACGLAWLAGTIGCTTAVGASIFVAARDYGGGLGYPLALALVLPQLHGALPFALFGLGARALQAERRAPAVTAIALAALWVATEMLRARAGYGLPWILLAHAQHARPWILQVADLGGAPAVSWTVALVNAGLALALDPARSWRNRGTLAALGALVLAAVASYGTYALGAWEHVAGPTLEVALVQPAVPAQWRTSLAGVPRVAARLRELTGDAAHGRPRLVVWPENAIAIPIEANPRLVADAAAPLDGETRVLLGGSRVVAAGSPGAPLRNAAYLVDRSGTVHGVYDKRRLTPFGEYVPWPLRLVVSMPDLYAPGSDAALLAVDGHPLGLTICAEAIDADLVRADVAAGAELLVNLAHDGWFAGAAARAQHFHAAALRAVENRRAVLRATSDGITAVVDARGVPVAMAPVGAPAILAATVPLIRARTPYTRVGDAFGWGCVALALGGMIAARRRARPGAGHHARPGRAATAATMPTASTTAPIAAVTSDGTSAADAGAPRIMRSL